MFHTEDRAAGKDKNLTFSWGHKVCQVKNGIHFTHSFLHCCLPSLRKKQRCPILIGVLRGGGGDSPHHS